MPEGVRITLSPPGIGFYDPDGNLMFSTADKLFRVTDVVIGQLQLAARTTPVVETNDYALGSCHASADSVMGYIKFDYTQTGFQVDSFLQWLPADTWFYVSGSYVNVYGTPTVMMVYSFRADAGYVIVEEHA